MPNDDESKSNLPVRRAIPSAPVRVHTADGTVFEADHVIVTCSVGFLKKNAHHMFQPLLPNDKLAAIHRLGFGTVNKIFLEFEQPWWDKDSNGMQFAWTNGEPFVLRCVDNVNSAEVSTVNGTKLDMVGHL